MPTRIGGRINTRRSRQRDARNAAKCRGAAVKNMNSHARCYVMGDPHEHELDAVFNYSPVVKGLQEVLKKESWDKVASVQKKVWGEKSFGHTMAKLFGESCEMVPGGMMLGVAARQMGLITQDLSLDQIKNAIEEAIGGLSAEIRDMFSKDGIVRAEAELQSFYTNYFSLLADGAEATVAMEELERYRTNLHKVAKSLSVRVLTEDVRTKSKGSAASAYNYKVFKAFVRMADAAIEACEEKARLEDEVHFSKEPKLDRTNEKDRRKIFKDVHNNFYRWKQAQNIAKDFAADLQKMYVAAKTNFNLQIERDDTWYHLVSWVRYGEHEWNKVWDRSCSENCKRRTDEYVENLVKRWEIKNVITKWHKYASLNPQEICARAYANALTAQDVQREARTKKETHTKKEASASAAGVDAFSGVSAPHTKKETKQMKRVYIQNVRSGKVLECKNGATVDGTNIWQCEMNGTAAQIWCIMNEGSIMHCASGKCLDVDGGGTASGTNVQLYTRNGTPAQKWSINADGTIVNLNSGKALDINGGSKDNGANVQICTINGTGAQNFRVVYL